MKQKRVLVLGAGVAGCSVTYLLRQKGYRVTLLEKDPYVGGLARTRYYAGHPYEFGPHIWFWPHDDINDVVRELTDDELLYIDRRLFTYIEKDDRLYRYPVHYEDVQQMPDRDAILAQLPANRDRSMKLVEEKLPVLGQCSFEEYFVAALGRNLYEKFMAQYTWKMWGIPGHVLQTSMVWADRIKDAYQKLRGYDPLKFEDHTLGKGLPFQVYPRAGWNQVWTRMVEGTDLRLGTPVHAIGRDERGWHVAAGTDRFRCADYEAVINTLDIDRLWDENTLPYTGRIMVPLLLKQVEWAFPGGAESIHYAGTEFQTRVTEMKRITQHQSPDTLILIEIPVLHTAENAFPANVMTPDHFCAKAYPQQSEAAFAKYDEYLERGGAIPNLFHCGRHAQFKYWGMPETVNAAYQLVKKNF